MWFFSVPQATVQSLCTLRFKERMTADEGVAAFRTWRVGFAPPFRIARHCHSPGGVGQRAWHSLPSCAGRSENTQGVTA